MCPILICYANKTRSGCGCPERLAWPVHSCFCWTRGFSICVSGLMAGSTAGIRMDSSWQGVLRQHCWTRCCGPYKQHDRLLERRTKNLQNRTCACRVIRLVRAIRRGWIKLHKEAAEQEDQPYLMWADDGQVCPVS